MGTKGWGGARKGAGRPRGKPNRTKQSISKVKKEKDIEIGTKSWGGARKGAGRPRGKLGKTWDINEAKKLRDLGLTYREIGEKLGVSPSNISSCFKARGWITSHIEKPEGKHNWNKILAEGNVLISRRDRSTRRIITFQGESFIYARVLWNVNNPDNIVESNEIIHHKNEDPLDDFIENLEKLTYGEHQLLHSGRKPRQLSFLKLLTFSWPFQPSLSSFN